MEYCCLKGPYTRDVAAGSQTRAASMRAVRNIHTSRQSMGKRRACRNDRLDQTLAAPRTRADPQRRSTLENWHVTLVVAAAYPQKLDDEIRYSAAYGISMTGISTVKLDARL